MMVTFQKTKKIFSSPQSITHLYTYAKTIQESKRLESTLEQITNFVSEIISNLVDFFSSNKNETHKVPVVCTSKMVKPYSLDCHPADKWVTNIDDINNFYFKNKSSILEDYKKLYNSEKLDLFLLHQKLYFEPVIRSKKEIDLITDIADFLSKNSNNNYKELKTKKKIKILSTSINYYQHNRFITQMKNIKDTFQNMRHQHISYESRNIERLMIEKPMLRRFGDISKDIRTFPEFSVNTNKTLLAQFKIDHLINYNFKIFKLNQLKSLNLPINVRSYNFNNMSEWPIFLEKRNQFSVLDTCLSLTINEPEESARILTAYMNTLLNFPLQRDPLLQFEGTADWLTFLNLRNKEDLDLYMSQLRFVYFLKQRNPILWQFYEDVLIPLMIAKDHQLAISSLEILFGNRHNKLQDYEAIHKILQSMLKTFLMNNKFFANESITGDFLFSESEFFDVYKRNSRTHNVLLLIKKTVLATPRNSTKWIFDF